MAVDEAILESVTSQAQLPTLRLYAWDPPCLSLGYAQNRTDVNDHALSHKNWDLVRRPTGGRAILHTDELTYSVCAPLKEPRVMGSVLESYCRLSKALLSALRILGIEAVAHELNQEHKQKQPSGPVCFEEPSNYEITVNGKKLIGSAQARRMEGVLQHGSIPIHGDISRILESLSFANDAEREKAQKRLLDHATTIEMVLGREFTWDEIADAFRSGFSNALSIEFIDSQLSRREKDRAEELKTQKFGNPSWTDRV